MINFFLKNFYFGIFEQVTFMKIRFSLTGGDRIHDKVSQRNRARVPNFTALHVICCPLLYPQIPNGLLLSFTQPFPSLLLLLLLSLPFLHSPSFPPPQAPRNPRILQVCFPSQAEAVLPPCRLVLCRWEAYRHSDPHCHRHCPRRRRLLPIPWPQGDYWSSFDVCLYSPITYLCFFVDVRVRDCEHCLIRGFGFLLCRETPCLARGAPGMVRIWNLFAVWFVV